VSSIATAAVGGRAPFQRFADGFGRTSAVLSALALLVAVGMSVPSSWFAFGGHDHAAPAYSQLEPSAPVRLAVAGVDLVTPLIAADVDPRTALADPPADAPLVSWWSGSAKPGAEHGQTVLTGHATEAGGALGSIDKLDKGDFVDLLTRQGTMRYEVDSVRTFDPAAMERAGITLFKQDGGAGRLVMVSGEVWDGAGYQRSVVVTAAPLGQPTS
jgi:Sortase domain